MTHPTCDKEAIEELRFRVSNNQLTDFAGYASKDELYRAVEAMGDSPDPDIRGHVQFILYLLDRERAFTHLIRCLSDPDEYCRAVAVELLGWYGEKITPYLIPLLQNDPCPGFRTVAAGMLGYFGT
ncbi:MAG: HEAT repeat domain-containing protein [Thermogemmata sp.]|nr:HEAT repeat domain-containing protein [Thermogemmata sp.]